MASLPPINPRTSAAGPISELSVILPRLPLDSSDRRLHCEDGPEPGFALRNAVVGLRCLCQWVRLHNGFNFSFRYEIKRFVEIFGDRKSTRLNSSHVSISYAVFCLKK